MCVGGLDRPPTPAATSPASGTFVTKDLFWILVATGDEIAEFAFDVP